MDNKKKILVVDDSTTVQEFALFSLKMLDFDVQMAGDGLEAISCLSKEKFDLAIVDLTMPNMDGYTLIEMIRASDDYSEIPIMVLTSDHSREAEKRALSVGANVFVKKPFNKDVIQKEVLNLLNNNKS